MKRRIRTWGPGFLLISPSLIALGWFVYYFMYWNARQSFSSWVGQTPANDFIGFKNYVDLFGNERFQIDVRNIIIFTVVFIGGSLVLGFFMALLLEKGVRFESFFRSVYLFPMAISFIATAIIWRWLLNNGDGASTAGLNKLFSIMGMDFLFSNWHKT